VGYHNQMLHQSRDHTSAFIISFSTDKAETGRQLTNSSAPAVCYFSDTTSARNLHTADWFMVDTVHSEDRQSRAVSVRHFVHLSEPEMCADVVA